MFISNVRLILGVGVGVVVLICIAFAVSILFGLRIALTIRTASDIWGMRGLMSTFSVTPRNLFEFPRSFVYCLLVVEQNRSVGLW